MAFHPGRPWKRIEDNLWGIEGGVVEIGQYTPIPPKKRKLANEEKEDVAFPLYMKLHLAMKSESMIGLSFDVYNGEGELVMIASEKCIQKSIERELGLTYSTLSTYSSKKTMVSSSLSQLLAEIISHQFKSALDNVKEALGKDDAVQYAVLISDDSTRSEVERQLLKAIRAVPSFALLFDFFGDDCAS